MRPFLRLLASKLVWLVLVVIGPAVYWLLSSLFQEQILSTAKDVSERAGWKTALLIAGRFWLENPVMVTAVIAGTVVAACAVTSAMQLRGGNRLGAKRLAGHAEWGITFIVNEAALPAAQLRKRFDQWVSEGLVMLEQEGCGETEISEFRVIGERAPIKTPGPTDDHRLIQEIAYTKARRLRAYARRIEGLPPHSDSPSLTVSVPPFVLAKQAGRREADSSNFSVRVRVPAPRAQKGLVKMDIWVLNRSRSDSVSLTFQLVEEGNAAEWEHHGMQNRDLPLHTLLKPQEQTPDGACISFRYADVSRLNDAEREARWAAIAEPDPKRLVLVITDEISGKTLRMTPLPGEADWS